MEDLFQHPMLVDMLSSVHKFDCIEIDLSYISDYSLVGTPEGRHSRLVLPLFVFAPPPHLHAKDSNYETSLIQPIENMRGVFLLTLFPLVSRRQIKACSLQDMAILRYLSEFHSKIWSVPTTSYRKNVRNQMRSPLLLDSLVISLRSLFHELIHAGSSTMTLSMSWTQIHVFSIEQGQWNLFPPNSISISYRPTLIFQSNWPQIQAPRVSKPLGNPILVKSRCIGCLATIVVRGK